MSNFTHVKLFLVLSIALFQTESFAQSKCENLFSAQISVSNTISKTGAQLLHEKDSKLHTSTQVEKTTAKHKRVTQESLTKPADKLNAWLTSLSKVAEKAESRPRVLDQIKTMLQNQHVIKSEDVPQGYYDLQVKLARERGHGDITLTNEQRKQLADNIIVDQKKSLDSWTEYLVSKDTSMYPMWLKYWIFTGMTKLSKYDTQTGKFGNRDKGTVAPFVELNREALGLIADYVLKYLDKKSLNEIQDPELAKLLPNLNFGKLYGHILLKLGVGKEGAFKTNQGQWVVYKQGTDHIPLVKSLEGRNTGWCTAGESTAKSQLDNGDFHVYYSFDDKGQPIIPRVAIRMEGDNIAEVRGVAASQNLDLQINQSTVVTTKMKEFGSKAEKFQKQDRDMKLLTQIEAKQNAKAQLNKEDLKFLWELNETIDGFGYQNDPRIEKIRSQRDRKSDIIFVFDNRYSRDQITTTRQEFLAAKGNSKIHLGDLMLDDIITVKGLKLPETLSGSLFLGRLTTAQGLKFPEILNGSLNLRSLTTAQGLKLPETLNGDLDLAGLRTAQDLNLPKTLNGYLDLAGLRTAQDLNLPKTLNGSLNLGSLTTAQGLKLPETLNGDINLGSLTTAQGLKFPEILRGSLNLRRLTTAQGLKLPETLNGDLNLYSLTTAQGLKLPETLNGNLFLVRLTTARGLKLPKGVKLFMGPGDIN